jgi:hypothetical protein
MKRAIFSALTAVVLAGLTGCITQNGRRPWDCMGGSCAQAPENGQACNGQGQACNGPGQPCNGQGQPCVDPNQGGDPQQAEACPADGRRCLRPFCTKCRPDGECCEGGPPEPTITYPYYTTRGPRDFLAKNPPSIGP